MRSSLTPSRKLKDPTSSLRQDILAFSVWTPQPILMVKTESRGAMRDTSQSGAVRSVGSGSGLCWCLQLTAQWPHTAHSGGLEDTAASLSLSLSLINTITHQTPDSLITSQLLDGLVCLTLIMITWESFLLKHTNIPSLVKLFYCLALWKVSSK